MAVKFNLRRRYFWLISIFLVIGLSLSFFPGYCWGLWGRKSLLLQYFFQCKCPTTSEQARYPNQVKVIISACHNSFVELSPSGRYLLVHEEISGKNLDYLLDFQTMDKIDVTNQPFSDFLTDSIGFIESGLEDRIVDRFTGTQYPIKSFAYWREDAYLSGEPNLGLLVATLRKAKQIFLIQNSDTVVVLMTNFPENPEQNFTFDRSDIPEWDSDRVEQFLQNNNVIYQTILASHPDEAVSPDGRFVARPEGIYRVETNERIVMGYSYGLFLKEYYSVRGWINDGSGVIYSSGNPCLIDLGVDIGCFYEVPQPVILLKLPDEYIMP